MKNYNRDEVAKWVEDNPNDTLLFSVLQMMRELVNKPSRKRRIKLENSIAWSIRNSNFRKSYKITK